jgi:vacuolar-type H+-ATPase subunit I/STV1
MDTKLEAVQESIKLALDAADAATDVTSEYNKVKKAHAILEAKVKQIHKYTTVVFVSSIVSGLVVIAVSAILFMQSSNKLSNMTDTSREALVVFAENVDGVNASLKNLDLAIKKQGDLLTVNQALVSTIDKVEKRIKESNDNTIGELRLITKTLISELNKTNKTNIDNNKKLNANLEKLNRSNSKTISKAINQISNKAIYKQIVANQAIQAQQISKLIKQNNNVLGKIANKTSRIKYP